MFSITEAKLVAVVTMVHEMIYVYRVINSMGLHLELLITADMKNSGAIDLVNSWSIDSRTHQVRVRVRVICGCSFCRS